MDNFFVKKKAIIPDNSIIIIISISIFNGKVPINESIAAAEPVLILDIVYNDINEKIITSVLVAPKSTRNPFSSVFDIVFPSIAAWPLPKPGRNPHMGDAIKDPNNGFFISFILNELSSKCCLGIFVLFFIDRIIDDDPNKPVSRGNNGSFNFRLIPNIFSGLSIITPKNPVIEYTNVEDNLFFSDKIINKEILIKRRGIIFVSNRYIFGTNIIIGNAITAVKIIAEILPYAVSSIASYPLPCISILWPGRRESSVSVSGQPKNMLGIKSRKVWVMDIATMSVIKYIGGIENRREIDRDTRIAATRFMWIPGVRPVNVPAIIPSSVNATNSSSI